MERAQSLRSFTEAVPLSLSSLAHESVPLEQGVLDGIQTLIQHTLTCCVQYARAMYAPYTNWTVRDLVTSQNAWKAVKVDMSQRGVPEIPTTFQKQFQFQHVYVRHCMIYIKGNGTNGTAANATGGGPIQVSQSIEMEEIQDNEWVQNQSAALAKISLYYASEVLLTPEEMNALSPQDLMSSDDDDDDDSHDAPPATLLYKVTIDYRTVPPSGKKTAKQAEELSMLSFGGSIDDEVKYGALASLYDPIAKYVLEIYSVRGKKYKFDLIQSTLSDGSLPDKPRPKKNRIAGTTASGVAADLVDDPFAKSLCVTVTNHTMNNSSTTINNGNKITPTAAIDNDETTMNNNHTNTNVITTMHLTLEGQLQQPLFFNNTKELLEQQLPSLTKYPYEIMKVFPTMLNPNLYSHQMVTSSNLSKHTLLLQPEYISKVYVNGRYMTSMTGGTPAAGRDIMNSSLPSLFGFDLLNIPTWHGRIMDYESMRQEYTKLWQEILTDVTTHQTLVVPGGAAGASSSSDNTLVSILLQRLMVGYDTYTTSRQFNKKHGTMEEDNDSDDSDDDGYYDTEEEEEEEEDNSNENKGQPQKEHEQRYQYCNADPSSIPMISIQDDCLEAEIMSNPKYDPVGICAAALGTYFYAKYGKAVYPCLAHEVDWVRTKLGDKIPKVVPYRLLKILRRCGYTNIQRYMSVRSWKFEQYLAEQQQQQQQQQQNKDGNDKGDGDEIQEKKKVLLDRGVELLQQSGIYDVTAQNVIWVSSKNFATFDPYETKLMCRYHTQSQTFFVNDALITKKHLPHHVTGNGDDDHDDDDDEEEEEHVGMEKRAFLLGMYIAQEHPDGARLVRYLLRHSNLTSPSSKPI